MGLTMNSSLNRRDLLKVGGGAIAAAALAPLAQVAQGTAVQPSLGKRRPIKKAVMWGMIRDGQSVLEKFQILKEAGFDGVELDSPKKIPNEEFKRASEQT